MQRLEQVMEIVKSKLIAKSLRSAANYPEVEGLVMATVRATLESLGPSGLILDSYGQLQSANQTRPRDDAGAKWYGGKKKR